jgi:DNA end-binding protein Ku
MARSLWTGSLSFGLVNVPVRLYSAVRDQQLHFTQLHEKDGAPIEVKRYCSKEDEEVPYEEVAHGYEHDKHGLVVLTDEDLATVSPRRTRTIEIDAFVDLAAVDPMQFDHPYLLAPAGNTDGTLRAYRLLVEVMGKTDRAALGRFVLRNKEYLVAIRVRDDRLALTTMRFADEIRKPEAIPTGGRKRTKKNELESAVQLIEALSTDWDPGEYKDRYRKRLRDVIKRKQKGETIKLPDEGDDDRSPVPDLMAALEKSLEAAHSK